MAESTKERILQAAFSFYAVPNFERVSLSQIAGRVGISKAAIFKHFKNKDALTQEMNNRICESLMELFAPMLQFFENGETGQAISFIIHYMLAHCEYLGYLLSMSVLLDENFVVSELRNRGVKLFDSIFNDDGTVKDLERYLLMEFLGNTLIYFTTKRIHDEDCQSSNPISREEFSESLCYLIENGIAKKDSSIDESTLSYIDSVCAERVKNIKPVNKILKEIAGIIDRVGIAGLTIEKIASALGMAKSSLYSSFENKVDMLSTLIEDEFETLRDFIISNISQVHSSYEKLYAIMQTEFCYFMERPELMLVFRNLLINKAVKDKLEPHADKKCGDAFLKDFCMDDFFSDSVLLWILVLPAMIYGSFLHRGLENDAMQSSLKKIFLMVEFGVKNK
ncbi:MAG: TetR/AcrR family transcriptional regulator [Treponema sp.]|nr:TetR/AcrR family transcriptional regulator [Treponema sp.]